MCAVSWLLKCLIGSLQGTALKMAAKTDVAFLSHSFLLGVSNCTAEAGMKADRSLPQGISQLKSSNPSQAPQHAHLNGNHLHFPVASTDAPGSRENLSDEDEEESCPEEEEEEMEEAPKKWQGIEAIFEAYQEYVDGESMSSKFYVCRPELHVFQGFTEWKYRFYLIVVEISSKRKSWAANTSLKCYYKNPKWWQKRPD